MAPRRRGERPLRRCAPQIDELARFVDCDSLRRRQDSSQGKSVDGAAYMPRRHQAIKRARRLAMLHASANRELPDDNPSSSLYRLLEAIDPIEDQP